MVHMKLDFNPSEPPFNLTAVYNYPQHNLRYRVWNALSTLADINDLPWLVIGDFNDILNPDDKLGGLGFNYSKT